MGNISRIAGMTGLTIGGTTPAPSDATAVDIINQGARDVVNRLIAIDPDKAFQFGIDSVSADNIMAATIPSKIIIEVSRENNAINNWRPCREISLNKVSEASDSASLHEATKFSPVFYRKGQKIYILPVLDDPTNNGGKVTFVEYPALYDETSVDSDKPIKVWDGTTAHAVADDVIDLILLYAGFKVLEAGLGTIRESSMPADLSIPDAPAAPVMGVLAEDFPVYDGPANIVLPQVPDDVDIDIVTLTASSPNFNAPASPVLTGIDLNFTATAPVFTAPVMGDLDFADTEDLITNEEDPEMLNARISEIQAKVGEYSALMQTANAQFSEENTVYQAALQTAMAQSKLDTQEEANKVQVFNSEFQNANTEFQTDLNVWQQKIGHIVQTYQAETGYDLSKFTAEVNATVTRFTNDLQLATAEHQNKIAKYTAAVQDLTRSNQEKLGLYGSSLQEHTSTVQSDVQEYTLKLQKDTTQYGWMQGQYVQLKQQYGEAFAIKAPQVGG
jgi:hypothetical protein